MTRNFEFKSSFNASRISEKLIAERQKKFERAMEEAAREIVERTQSGKDYQDRAFKKYSDSYAAWKTGFTRSGKRRREKIKSGKRAGKMRYAKINFGAGGNVNLTLTGRMLQNVTTTFWRTATELIGRITFSSQLEANKARGNMATRKFFALSRKQIESITNKLK